MEFNDGSQYRVVTDPSRNRRERPMYEFRACSATNGRNKYRDTAFDRHRRDFRGHPVLMYQFPYQNAGSPEAQADFFLSIVSPLGDLDMMMIDTEIMSGLVDPREWTRRWLRHVEAKTGKLCWIYVPSHLLKPLDRSLTGPRIVKAPRYSGSARIGAKPWWSHDVHQYTDRGYFPGCPQSGDVNVTSWTVQDLLRRCNGGGAPAVDTPKKRTNILLFD